MGSWFCNRLRLNFYAFALRGIYMTSKRAVMKQNSVTFLLVSGRHAGAPAWRLHKNFSAYIA